MIRTTREAGIFTLWRDRLMLRGLVTPACLTTARYEPTLRRMHGVGHVDLLFESGGRSCVVAGIRLDPNHLLIRHRSPIVWPAYVAAQVGHDQLTALEAVIVPWLRSLARANHMARESVRRFCASVHFERARAAQLVGAAPLDQTILKMAPFVYARRFARYAAVRIACPDGGLAHALLSDIARSIDLAPADGPDEYFEREWFGVLPDRASEPEPPELLLAAGNPDRWAPTVVDTRPGAVNGAHLVDVPAPVPWDLMFSFDVADAPAASRFAVTAPEPALREPIVPPVASAFGGSGGTIVLAVAPESAALNGPDTDEIRIFARRLAAEGFRVLITGNVADPALADAALIHIFGSPYEAHTIAFGEFAAARGLDFVFDLAPMSDGPSTFMETAFYLIHVSAHDDADLGRYLDAYERRRLDVPPDPNSPPEPEPQDYERAARRFTELTARAMAILTVEEDLEIVRGFVSAAAASRIFARGWFGDAEPEPLAIGHLVPADPFAFVHCAVARRSNALYVAVAAERHRIPLVIAGPVHEVDYLQALRTNAPSAVVLGDADAGTIAALYRSATVWVDAARRPRTATTLGRAIACGALPIVANESPFMRIVREDAPSFVLTSIDGCARTIVPCLEAGKNVARIDALRARLLPRRDPQAAFGAVIRAYSRSAQPV